ncbi:MAG: endonuclease NucS [Candidatus Aenigmarchaeota archaeon]|nr:endonuclease NucS [Candidatus Aenigmarchaeota archaeon]
MLSNNDVCILINDAIKRNETVVLACKCTVAYSGRAESYLEKGDRTIIIKGDHTLLVHQPFGNAAINYMKPDSSHQIFAEEKKILLKSSNTLQKEQMEIKIEKLYFFNSHKLEDGQTIVVTGTEEDMSRMLYENPHLIEEGFTPVSQEEQTKYGFIDVFGTDKNGNLIVVECKRYCAELSAVTQLRRYVEKIQESKGVKNVRGILAAPKITPNAEKMLTDWGYSFVAVQPPKYYEKFDKHQTNLSEFTAFGGSHGQIQ